MDVAAVAGLAFVASITPGPNNLMLWASGLNHGIKGTLRHLAGVNLGFSFLLFVVAVGLGSVFERWPLFETTLKLAGGTYLLYLSYRIFTTNSVESATGDGETSSEVRPPLTFVQASAFQWVNPKAWVFTTTAVSTGLSSDAPLLAAALALTALVAVINLPCISAWMVSGSLASHYIRDARRVRIANRTLGLMLAGTVGLIVT